VGRCDDSRVAEIVEWIFRKFLTLVLSIVTAAIVVQGKCDRFPSRMLSLVTNAR
jgi:hypothetical protein